MAALERVHHTSFTVSDLDRSLAFYRDQLATRQTEGGHLAAVA